MKKPYTFISKDRNILLEMLSLRKSGWTFVSLAELFNCDRTSIRYQCRKYQIFPEKTIFIKNSNQVFDPKRIVTQILIELDPQETSIWSIIDGERVNTGKSYADYLKSVSPYKRNLL